MADAGLQMSAIQSAQAGQTPDQIAATAQNTVATNAAASASSSTPNFNTINSGNLAPTTPVKTPIVTSPDTSSSLAAGATQTVDQVTKALTPAPTALDNTQQSLLDSISSLTGQDSGKAQALVDAQGKSGATQDNADLTSLNNQLKTKTASYDQLQANLGGNGSVETSAVLAAQNAGLTKARAADLGVLTAQIQAKQGDLTLAMSTAKDAVDAKYSTIEDNIKTQQAQLNALAPALSAQEKTQALAQQTVLAQQAQAVADQKAKETQINSIALNAASAGANQATIQAITNSTDVLSAINAAAPALGAKVANDLKQTAFDNALKLRTAANDAIRVGIEQQNANLALQKFQLDKSTAALSALNAGVTTPSGKKYIDGTNLDAAGKAAALNAGQIVLSGDSSKAMTSISNVQGALGSLLASLQSNGVDLTKMSSGAPGAIPTNQGATTGFLQTWAAGAATPAVNAFGTNLKSMITDLQKLPGTGSLVNTLQANVLSGKDSASTMQTKITNIAKALEDSTNSLLINNSSPAQMTLPNGTVVTLQADGTYQ